MKYLLLLFSFLSLSITAQDWSVKDHDLWPSIETYYENINYFQDTQDILPHQAGVEVNVKFEFRDPKLQFIGADFGFGFNSYENFFKLHFGLAFRRKLFNDAVEMSIIIPRLSAPLDGIKKTGYNTPYGWSCEIFRSSVRVKMTQHYYKNAISSRIGLVYLFKN